MDNSEVVRRIQEAWNANDMATIDQLIAPDFIAHTPGADMLPPGLEGAKQANEQAVAAWSDKMVTIQDLFGEGDRVVVRTRMTGKNTGGLPFFGIPANDATVDFESTSIYRLKDGKVVETWAQIEVPKLMQQLSAMPGPEGM